jgi:hypothetical protein
MKKSPFGELCERPGKKVFGVVHRMMRNREDAEDALQDCLLNAFAQVKDFDERSRFATWLTPSPSMPRWRSEIAMDEPTPPSEPGRHRGIQDDAPDPEETYRFVNGDRF